MPVRQPKGMGKRGTQDKERNKAENDHKDNQKNIKYYKDISEFQTTSPLIALRDCLKYDNLKDRKKQADEEILPALKQEEKTLE
jgi:hypothetical protein